jgi:hypothetical protein
MMALPTIAIGAASLKCGSITIVKEVKMPITGDFFDEIDRRLERGCKEVDYHNPQAAERIARKMEEKYNKAFNHYRCEKCTGWHVGRTNKQWYETEAYVPPEHER